MRRLFSPSAFSLVEIVLAIGIVSFSLLTIVGLFGGMMKTSGDNIHRRQMIETVDSLRAYLHATNFNSAYDSVRTNQEFLYLTYKQGADGSPDINSQTVSGKWTNGDATNLDSYESARSGRWLRAKLNVSPSNPSGTNLPAAASYSNATLFVLADIWAIATPGQTTSNTSHLQTTFVLSR